MIIHVVQGLGCTYELALVEEVSVVLKGPQTVNVCVYTHVTTPGLVCLDGRSTLGWASKAPNADTSKNPGQTLRMQLAQASKVRRSNMNVTFQTLHLNQKQNFDFLYPCATSISPAHHFFPGLACKQQKT